MTILDKAKSLVQGARNKSYGHPREDFRCQAQMFNAYLQKKGILDPESHDGLQPEDVAMLMVLVKVARMAQKYGEDHLVDIAGYAAACEMSQEEENNPKNNNNSCPKLINNIAWCRKPRNHIGPCYSPLIYNYYD